MHLLIPMSGAGSRYQRAGYADPKPLIAINGTPMIERLLASFPATWPCTFVLAEDHRTTALPALLQRLRPAGQLVYVDHATPCPAGLVGPARATLAGLEGIAPDAAVLVSYCDYGLVWDATQFERFTRDSRCDACLVSYRGFHAHYLGPQMYAYARLEGDLVREVQEKACFTADREQEYASAGAYYFRTARELREALEHQAQLGLITNGEHYVSLTVEALLRRDLRAHVRVFEVPGFFQWGTPDDLRDFEYWERTFRSWNAGLAAEPGPAVAQTLVPMAGLGSRFSAHSSIPKPFLDVRGRPMVRAALASLPPSRATVVVALEDHRELVEHAFGDAPATRRVFVQATPAGQALSTEAGLTCLDLAREVLVSACDHEIVLSADRWTDFHAAPDCDAAVFTVRGFPGARRHPRAYAYVVPASDGPFPAFDRVSVKSPVSPRPEADHLLVGTFWFASGKVLAAGIAALKRQDLRVNGELYLDSILSVLKAQGLRLRIIELDGYINRGDPDSFAESTYFQEAFGGRLATPRSRLTPFTR